MKKFQLAAVSILSLALFTGNDWLQFRGPNANNVIEADIPVELGEAENIAWKVELPGKGPSGPIVVGNKVIVTCSKGANQDRLFVVCYDADSGEKVWQREFWATGRSFCHPLSANAAPTPTCDGENIYAFFSSNDLICLDLDGNLKWFRGLGYDHPKAGHDTGMSSSPVVADGVVVCQVENQGDSFATGIDTQTGKTVWEIERSRDASWASPVLLNSPNGTMALLQSGDRATVVNVKTGEKIWEVEGRCNPIPSTTIFGDRMYLPLGGTTVYQMSPEGTFNEVWKSERVAPGSPSLLADGENLYTVNRGIVNCFDAQEGATSWKVRVGGSHWTTPLIAGKHMYLFTQDGEVAVLNLSDGVADEQRKVYETKFEDEVFLASPAVSGQAMFMRSDKYLYKFQNN